MSETETMRVLFAAQALPEVYRAAVDIGADDQKSIIAEAFELADAALLFLKRPDPRDKEIAALRRTIAAFKANSTRRRAK